MMRALLLASIVLVLLSVRVDLSQAQAGPTVTDTGTGLDIAFPNGHHLLWGKSGCYLDYWRDAQGHTLGRFNEVQVNIPSGIGGTTYPSNQQVQNYTVTGAAVTVNCTADWPGVAAVPLHYTFVGADRTFGVPYHGVTWQITVDY